MSPQISKDITSVNILSLFSITLSRPSAYNALNLEMVTALTAELEKTKNSPELKAILIRSSMDKVFCAGGDIKAAYYAKNEENHIYLDNFFRSEYQLNYLMSTYPKPIIALINGLTLGGGMGLAMHSKYRVVNENAELGMPETTIGFFTDVGAGYFYKKLPLSLNLYFSLTGKTLNHNQALRYGLATHFVPKEQESFLVEDLGRCQSENEIVKCLNKYAGSQIEPEDVDIDIINNCFKDDSIEAILKRLKEHPSKFAQDTLNFLLQKSPTSLKVVFELIKRSHSLSLKEVLEQDFILSQNFMDNPDCIEGVRAQVIDKDRNPKWNPAHLNEVTDEMVSKYFVAKQGLKNLFEE